MLSRIVRQVVDAHLVGMILALTVFGQATQPPQARELLPGETSDREIAGAGQHRYRFGLREGEFFQVRVEQKGVDVLLKLVDTGGAVLATMDMPIRTDVAETLSFIADKTGVYTLEVVAVEVNAKKGSYRIQRAVARTATAQDRKRVEVERTFMEGVALRKVQEQSETVIKKYSAAQAGWQELADTYMADLAAHQIKRARARALLFEGRALYFKGAESLIKAKETLLESRRLYVEAGDANGESGALIGLGLVMFNLKDFGSAEEFFKQGVRAARASETVIFEAEGLYSLGSTYSTLGKKREALDHFNQALRLFRDLKSPGDEVKTLAFIGGVYQAAGENRMALDFHLQALSIIVKHGYKDAEAHSRLDIGSVYTELGQHEKAFGYINGAMLIYKALKDKCGEAAALTSASLIHSKMGEKAKALNLLLDQALPLYNGLTECFSESTTLVNIGKIYYDLGENSKALKYYEQSLPPFRAKTYKYGEAATLSNIGAAHYAMGEPEQALGFYEQALSLYKAIGESKGQATTLTNIGVAYSKRGEYRKALDIFEQALTLRMAVGDKGGEAVTLTEIGQVHSLSGDKGRALEHFNQALPLFRAAGDRNGEAVMLANAMAAWESLGNRRMAIFYGIQSVNMLQELRGAAQGIDKEIQKTFLRAVKNPYQYLAELLIKEGLPHQAIEVLNLYQDQQFFDFNRDANAPVKQLAFSPREKYFADRYISQSKNIEQISAQIEDLQRQNFSRRLNEQESARLQELRGELATASGAFRALIKEAEKELAKPSGEIDKRRLPTDVTELQSTLRQLGEATKQNTVALYTFVGGDEFYLLLVTPFEIKSFASPIKAADLNAKILEFYALLQSPKYDPRRLGKELYGIILKRAEAGLKKANVQTLMWMLDGTLRYMPMAALSPDGKSYLINRYQSVVFTRADRERMTRSVSPNWTGTGFGSSQAHTVDLFNDGDKIDFSALPGVTSELQAIFSTNDKDPGILQGEIFSDAQFSKDAFYEAMKQRRSVVHISSHFSFRPGDDARSFLLTGKGEPLTLTELRKHEKLFEGIEMLTLSACNTAATLPDAEGREIDGFAELAQRLGASSVLATLWPVSDASTPWLMSEFYQTRKANTGIPKSEALRKAQMALISGRANIELLPNVSKGAAGANFKLVIVRDSSKRRRDTTRAEPVYVLEKEAPLYKQDAKKPFAHPYYWSPFVLYGNWQ
jgi:CHAT domain-containing protein/Tfp pilus assembly protein PilF